MFRANKFLSRAACIPALLFLSGCFGCDASTTADAGNDAVPDEIEAGDDTRIPGPAVTLATWNLKQFPLSSSTITHVAATIQNLALDLVAVQEIQDTADFDSLLEALPGYDGVLYVGPYDTFNRIGLIWRTGILRLRDSRQILTYESHALLRAPVQGEFEVISDGTFVMDFTVITIHLKAGADPDDEAIRRAAMILLAEHACGLIDGPQDDEILLIGDFNEAPTDANAADVFAPFRSRSRLFRVLTWDLDIPEEATWIPGGIVLDHMISTVQLDEEIDQGLPEVPHVEEDIANYLSRVSDHRPVVLKLSTFYL